MREALTGKTDSSPDKKRETNAKAAAEKASSEASQQQLPEEAGKEATPVWRPTKDWTPGTKRKRLTSQQQPSDSAVNSSADAPPEAPATKIETEEKATESASAKTGLADATPTASQTPDHLALSSSKTAVSDKTSKVRGEEDAQLSSSKGSSEAPPHVNYAT